MKNIVKNTVVITLITLISGCLLGLVYEITKQPIAVQNEMAKQQAYQSVFSKAEFFDSFESLEKIINEAFLSQHPAEKVDELVEAKDASGNLLGYVVTVTSTEGYGGDIQLTMGVQLDGTINGISILSISETPGLGMNADTDEFKRQYAGKNVDFFDITKSGASAENEIDAISGATFTSKAVTNAVNAGLDVVNIVKEEPFTDFAAATWKGGEEG